MHAILSDCVLVFWGSEPNTGNVVFDFANFKCCAVRVCADGSQAVDMPNALCGDD